MIFKSSLTLLAVLVATMAGPALATPVSGGEYDAAANSVAVPERLADAPPPTRPVEAERATELGLPSQTEIERSLSTARRQEIEVPVLDRPADHHDADPLRSMARTLVNVSRPTEVRAAPGEAGDRGGRPPAGTTGGRAVLEFDDDLRTAVLDVKSAVADVARVALNPRADDNGRISFSVAGIEGFQLSSDGQALSLALGGTTLGSVTPAAAASSDDGYGPQARQARDLGDANPVRRVIDAIIRFVEHPLTWLVVAILLLGWLVVAALAAQTGRSRS